MKYCEHCKVKVDTDRKICPLCFNSLKSLSDNINNTKMANFHNYPNRKRKSEKYNLFHKILSFVCLLAIFASLIVDYTTHVEGNRWWSIFVVLGVIYIYTLIRGVILGRAYVIKRLLLQLVVVSIVIFGIDYMSDYHGWSLAIVIPCVCVANNLVNLIIAAANNRNFSDAFSSIIISLLIGIIPFILQIFDLVKGDRLWAPLVSASFSIVLLSAYFVFAGKRIKEELTKRLHV